MSARSLVRRGSLFLAAALLSACLPAQNPSPSTPDSAQQISRRVDRHYNALRSLKARFSETYEGLGMKRFDSGTLLLEKPGRMKWEYGSPPGKVFDLDGKYAWFYSPGDPQVQRMAAKELDDLRSPLRFLLGHTELEKELNGLAVKPAANGEFTLTGQPKGQQNRIRSLALTVTGEGAITGIEIEEVDGAITRFSFSDQQPDAPIPPGTFHFNAPPGVPVVNAPPPV